MQVDREHLGNIPLEQLRIDRVLPTRKHPALQMRAMEDF